MDEEIGGGLYPDGTPEDHARVEQLAAQFTAELDADRPVAAGAAAAWAAQSGLHVDAARLEDVLAARWEPSAQQGFFSMLEVLGIADPENPDGGAR